MVLSSRIARTTLSCAAALAAGCAAGPSMPPLTRSAPGHIQSTVRSATTTSEHVYVVDPGAARLFRFPVQGGVIAQTPDSTLDVPSGAAGVTVAHDGTMYVSDGRHLDILVYHAGAHNNAKPFRRIDTPEPAYELALDANGYLFARLTADNGLSEVAIISPQKRIVNLLGDTFASSVAIDGAGNLYVGGDPGVKVYANPDNNPTLLRSNCLSNGNIALSHTGRLFASKIGVIIRVKETLDACPVPRGRYEMKVNVTPPLYLFFMATGPNQLFTVEQYRARVLQLDPRPALQTPVAIVQYPGFQHPYGIAVGP